MINFIEINKVKLGKNQFKSITTDKKYIYLTYPKIRKIYKLDNKFNIIDKINVPYCIKHLTYDYKNKVFLGIENNNTRQIQVFDNNFNNIGLIPIPDNIYKNENIISIAFRQDSEEIILAFESYITSITNEGNYSIIAKNSYDYYAYTGTENLNHININTCTNKNKQYINIIQGNKKQLTFPLHGSAKVIDICLIYNKTGFYLYVLRTTENLCSFIDILKITNQNTHTCKKSNKKCNNNPQKINCNSYTDIVESIALIETSLSHVINAEGEKLQKIICKCDDVKTILKANTSVNETIINITLLEQILYQKLLKVISIDCKCSCNDDTEKQ